MNKQYKVCHVTSAHEQLDDRIYLKECISLANAGYETYIIARGESRRINDVEIVGCGYPKNRRDRMTGFTKRVFLKAKALDCDVYHIHDPELLPYGIKLKKAGKKVIFDSHEDVPAQILDKEWLPILIRLSISKIYKMYESYAVKQFDAVVTATSHIAEKFAGRCSKVVTINNYPKLNDIKFHKKTFAERENIICYAGSISEVRGEKIMVEAMKNVEGTLIMAGDHEKMSLPNVEYVGHLNRNEVNDLYGSAVVGLVILQPIKNYYYAQPIKMYEYMAAGLPYVCSNFPQWEKVAQDSGAGICVDPNNIEEISNAIILLLKDRKKAQDMGRKGREYLVRHCTWDNEEMILLKLYEDIIEKAEI